MKKVILLALLFILSLSGCSEKELTSDDIYEKFEKIAINDIPSVYSPEEAVESGDYVDVQGDISNKDTMTDFLTKVENCEETFLRTVTYTADGDPIIYDFYYDGEKFTVTTDYTRYPRGTFGARSFIIDTKEYKYMKTYSRIVDDHIYSYIFMTNLENIESADDIYGENCAILKINVSRK